MSEEHVIETSAGPALLKRSDRRTLAISVLPDGSLEVVSPRSATTDEILAKVAMRSRWIAAQRRAFQQMNARPVTRRFVSGATHRYLGRQYLLKVRSAPEAKVRLKGGYFHVEVPMNEPAEIERALSGWYHERTHEQFTKRLHAWENWCKKQQLPAPRLQIRKMSKRWGSAATDGRISLNPELIRASSRCIDYVITHEICHLRHPNHGPGFYRLLSTLLPDWKRLKQRLEEAEIF